LECRDDPVELAFEEWRNTPQPDHDLAAPHDVGAPSPDSPRPRKIGSRLPFRKLCAGRPLMPRRGNGGICGKKPNDPLEAASRQVPSRGEANFLCGRRRRRCGQPTRRSSAASIGSAPLAHHSVPELTHDCDPGRLGMGPFAFRCWMLRIPTANQFSFFVFGLIPLPCCSDLALRPRAR
jgi:hypothetical protein